MSALGAPSPVLEARAAEMRERAREHVYNGGFVAQCDRCVETQRRKGGGGMEKREGGGSSSQSVLFIRPFHINSPNVRLSSLRFPSFIAPIVHSFLPSLTAFQVNCIAHTTRNWWFPVACFLAATTTAPLSAGL